MSIDITELCKQENVPSIDEFTKGNANVNNIGKNEGHKFSGKSNYNASKDLYEESTESFFDALLGIYDDENDFVETNLNTTRENMSIENYIPRKDIAKVIRGTKRKISEVSNKKDGKYHCQQCDYEAC